MPSVSEVEIAATRLRRENRRVSVRNVRAVLPRGGSYSDIGPPLAEWKAKANYRPKSLPKEIPASMSPVIEEFAARLWAAARDEAEKVVEGRMAMQAELEREFEKEAGIAWAEVDRLMEVVTTLRTRLAEAGVPVAPTLPPIPARERRPGPAGEAPRRPAPARVRRVDGSDVEIEKLLTPLEKGWKGMLANGITPRKFWDALVREAALVIEASGRDALSARDILVGLPDPVLSKAGEFETLTEAVLREKLTVRSENGKYVRKRDDGSFEALRDRRP
jgi:hypothetical protein